MKHIHVFLWLFSCATPLCAHTTIDVKKAFLERLHHDPPQWMARQIEDDFSPFFYTGISLEHIKSAQEQLFVYSQQSVLMPFATVHIIDGKIDYTPNAMSPCNETEIALHQFFRKRLDIFIQALTLLTRCTDIPDLYFVLDLSDFGGSHLSSNDLPILGWNKVKQRRQGILIPDTENLGTDYAAVTGFTMNAFEENSSADTSHHITDILGAEIIATNNNRPWNMKIRKAFWRGRDTGAINAYYFYKTEPPFTMKDKKLIRLWHKKQQKKIVRKYRSPRLRLVELSFRYPQLIDARFNTIIHKKIFDLLKKTGHQKFIGYSIPITDHLYYRYLLSLDGHTATWGRLRCYLASNSLVLKQDSDWIQWYYNALQPYTHYVPIKHDLSNLVETIEWAKQHDDETEKIAQQATTFVQENLQYPDLIYYLYLVLCKYASLQTFDPKEIVIK